MPARPTDTQIQLKNIATFLTVTAYSVEILADSLKAPFLIDISDTTQSLLKNIETVKQNKNNCIMLLGETYGLLNAIIMVHIKSGGELLPNALSHIGQFAETLYKIHTFVEAQQSASKVKMFLRQGEMSVLLKECRAGLKQGLDFFKVKTGDIMTDITKLREDAEQRHNEVLGMIQVLTEISSSDSSSTISRVYSGYYNSSNSMSMLPSEPKIFHGRASELSDILNLLSQGTSRIAILGAGGMGKTSLARAVVHDPRISARYDQHRYFVACDSATNQLELAALIGAHLGLKPSKDLTQPVVQHFTSGPPSLLVLDNLETVWEPADSRSSVEGFLSLITAVNHLALMVTMRGAERPAQVHWTRPFLLPLRPLEQDAARQTFMDIAGNSHNPDEVDKVLLLTDNMPLAITLLAHLVDSEGCTYVLSRWEEEKTSLISDGFDKRSNLDLSISVSMSSPRIKACPHAQDLLGLLSMLPDGLSNVELVQSKLPIDGILSCKAALVRTALAYSDEQKRLKALVPIRQYILQHQPPGHELVRSLLKYFQQLLEFYTKYHGTQKNSGTVAQISSNFANIQNILQNGLQSEHPDLKDIIYCICHLNMFSSIMRQGTIPLFDQIYDFLPEPCDHHLTAFVMTGLLCAWRYYPIVDLARWIAQALEHSEQCDDPNLQCRLYIGLADYYWVNGPDFPNAMKFCQAAISLAISSGNTERHSQGLYTLAWINWHLGAYSAAQVHAYESQRLARLSANLYMEAMPLRIEAMCWTQLGHYKQSISLCNRARALVTLSGMAGGELDSAIVNHQAEIHRLKSEYNIAHNIYSKMLQEPCVEQDLYHYAVTVLNTAEIGVSLGAPTDCVQTKICKAQSIFKTMKRLPELGMCDATLAKLHLRDGNALMAKALLEKCIKLYAEGYTEIVSYCLEQLGNASRWGTPSSMSNWTTLFLVYSLKFREKLGVYKALHFLGEIFLDLDDHDTSTSLFIVALEGFTQMDVHCSRAECMLQLGHIADTQGNLVKAVELWNIARPLFEKASQAKYVEDIDTRLALVDKDVLEQHSNNLIHLEELISPTSIGKEVEENLSNFELPQVELDAVNFFERVAI